jgi:predicted nucleotidyltransferase
VVCAYVYGSWARGEAAPDSDVDVGVVLKNAPPSRLLGPDASLRGDPEDALGRPLDLVVLNRAPVDLIHRVLRDGVLLADHDPTARIHFEVRARNEYFDLLPYLQEYRRGGAS